MLRDHLRFGGNEQWPLYLANLTVNEIIVVSFHLNTKNQALR